MVTKLRAVAMVIMSDADNKLVIDDMGEEDNSNIDVLTNDDDYDDSAQDLSQRLSSRDQSAEGSEQYRAGSSRVHNGVFSIASLVRRDDQPSPVPSPDRHRGRGSPLSTLPRQLLPHASQISQLPDSQDAARVSRAPRDSCSLSQSLPGFSVMTGDALQGRSSPSMQPSVPEFSHSGGREFESPHPLPSSSCSADTTRRAPPSSGVSTAGSGDCEDVSWGCTSPSCWPTVRGRGVPSPAFSVEEGGSASPPLSRSPSDSPEAPSVSRHGMWFSLFLVVVFVVGALSVFVCLCGVGAFSQRVCRQ